MEPGKVPGNQSEGENSLGEGNSGQKSGRNELFEAGKAQKADAGVDQQYDGQPDSPGFHGG